MEKLFKNFEKARKNEGYKESQRTTLLTGLLTLSVDKFNLSSFLKDLKTLDNESVFTDSSEYEQVKRILLEKEKAKINATTDEKKVQKELETLRKLKDKKFLSGSELYVLSTDIENRIKNIKAGKGNSGDESVEKKAKEVERFIDPNRRNAYRKFLMVGIPTTVAGITAIVILTAMLLNSFVQKPGNGNKGKSPEVEFNEAPKKDHSVKGTLSALEKAEKNAKNSPEKPDVKKIEPDDKIPLDTLIGYDKMQATLSERLNKLKPMEKEGMERALRYIMLAQAKKTASPKDGDRIDKALIALNNKKNENPYDWAGVAFMNQFEEDGYKRIVPKQEDAKKGELVITYGETLDALEEFYKRRCGALERQIRVDNTK